MPFIYNGEMRWSGYSRFMIDPVTIYNGPDNQFDSISESDRVMLADYMKAKFAERLVKKLAYANSPGTDVIRVRLTLTGAVANTPILAPLSRFDVAGGLYNGVQTLRDREGSMTGAVMFVVELYDSKSNRLLHAYVSKQYPKPYDIGASMGSIAAAKAGIDRGAEELAASIP